MRRYTLIIVDTELKKREGNPIKVGLIGAGFMSKGIMNQVLKYMPAMDIPVVCNRTVSRAKDIYMQAGVPEDKIVEVKTLGQLEDAMASGNYAITDDYMLLCQCDSLEVLLEATGHVEYGAHVTMAAFANNKHMVTMNAELDGTVGPLLKKKAEQAGVVFTGCDGDQPGVQMNLYRFVESMGFIPRICGNIKGLHDPYRNPTTQEGFAKQWGQTPSMVTSFADGTKISYEQAIVANATGMKVAKLGMLGYEHDGHIDDAVNLYDLDQVRELGGIVDYVVKTRPGPGVYVFAEAQDDMQAHYLNLAKLGKGPLYSFYAPYHLIIFEVPLSVARVALFKDHVITPINGPMVDVVAAAKTDLKAGDTVDGLGWYMTYGLCENIETAKAGKMLPIGIAENCKLKRDIPKDQVLTYDDVELPADSLAVKLRQEQDELFA